MKKKWLSLPLACMLFISACSTPGKNLPSTGSTGTTVPTRVSSVGLATTPDKSSTTNRADSLKNSPSPPPKEVHSPELPEMPTCSQKSFRREFDEFAGMFTISCETVGAQIYYSINGGEYQEYDDNNEIYFTRTTKVETYAELSDGRKSETNTYTYELLPRYSIEVKGNSPEAETVIVKIETAVKEVIYYYTTDGSVPTQDSPIYTGPLEIEKKAHFRVLAVKEGWSDFRQGATFSLTSSGDSKLDEDYQNRYLYNTLSENDKEIYKRIYEAFNERKNTVNLVNLEIPYENEPIRHLMALYYNVYFENPQLLYQPYISKLNKDDLTMEGEYIKEIELAKKYIRSNEIEENCEEFNNVTKEVIKEAQKLSSDYERIRYIHDWIVRQTIYGNDDEVEPYVKDTDGSPVYGKADCCGYSRIFCYLTQSLGYDTIVISGEGRGEPHAWNAIQTGDKWYLVDVLWDYNKEIDNGIGYRYFLRSEEEFAADHEIHEIMKFNTENEEEFADDREKDTVDFDYPEFNSSFA